MKKIQIFENVFKCKWTTLVLDQISNGVKQPGELKRSIDGITKKVLYERLKKLERFNMINRKLISKKPLKVYYTLTPLGKKISKIVNMVKSLD